MNVTARLVFGRWSLVVAAGLLPLAGGVAQAQTKPTEAPPQTGVVTAQPGTFVVDIEKVTLSANGKTVQAAPPGVPVTITVRLHNLGQETAKNVRAHIDEPEHATVTDADASYPDIAGGGGADGAFTIVVDRVGCPSDYVGIAGEVTYEGGAHPLKMAIATACPGPRLSLAQVTYEGGDGDGVPEPGETLRAFVDLRNDGRDPATDVAAAVNVSGTGVSTATNAISWPDVAPGVTKRSSTPVVLTISRDAPRQDECPAGPGPITILPGPSQGAPEGTGPGAAQDVPVSSEGSGGSVGSGGSGASEPGFVGGAPGSSGAGSSGSGSSGTPTVVEPVSPETAGQGKGAEPIPLPTVVHPVPAKGAGRPVSIEMHFAARAAGASARLDYSNGLVCALEGVPAKGGPDRLAAPLPAFASDADARRSGGVVLPVLIAAVVSAAAVGARGFLVR